jgi:16S rRNA (uracil1498-N3)-methyltransferase
MESFYVSPGNVDDTEIVIEGEESHHLTRVVRAEAGETILAVDGEGTAYRCRIASIDRNAVRCGILEKLERYNEPKVEVSLMLPVLKNHNRVEWIVEKGTELGVCRFIPVQTERTIARRVRHDRLRKIAFAAMKQSKRSFLPEITETKLFPDLLAGTDSTYDKVYIGHEEEPLSDTLIGMRGQLTGQRVLLLVGPEGGFTGGEMERARGHGAQSVSLGLRRYRAETAAIIMAAYVVHD